MKLLERTCPLCHSQQQSTIFAEANVNQQEFSAFTFSSRKLPDRMHFRLCLCHLCDLLYVNPAPTATDLQNLYVEADFDSTLEAQWASRSYAHLLPTISKKLPDVVGALDVGTGEGSFLQQLLDAGFSEIVGVEPSLKPIQKAKENIRPLIKQSIFSAADFPTNHFSLISCFQTIEHVLDPLAMCSAFHSLLKKGGAVFIVGHNFRSWSTKLLGLRSPIFDVEHMQLFSPTSMKELLKRAGFSTIEVMAISNQYPLSYYLKLFPFPTMIKEKLLTLAHTLGCDQLTVRIPLGNSATIGYK